MLPEQGLLYPGTPYFGLRPGFFRRLHTRETGLWQISDRNACSFAARAVHDGRYANTMSLSVDLNILVKTIGVVIRGTGY